MLYLILGLVIFIGIHLVRMVAPQWREAKLLRWVRGNGRGFILWCPLLALASSFGVTV